MRKAIITMGIAAVLASMASAQADTPNTIRYSAKGCVLNGTGNCQFNVTGSNSYDRGWGGLFFGSATISHLVVVQKSGPAEPSTDANNCSPAYEGCKFNASQDAGSGTWSWSEYVRTVDVTFGPQASSCNACFNKPATFPGLVNGVDYTLTCTGCTGIVAAGALEP